MVYKPLAEWFFQGVSKLERLSHLCASLILYEPCIFEWEMVHDIVPNADKIISIEDRELKLADFVMLCRRLDAHSWIFQAYRSMTLRIAESLTNDTVVKLTKLIRRADRSKKLTMTLSGAINGKEKLEPAYANGNLESFIVYSSFAHRNDIDLFISDQSKLEKWSNLAELKLYGLHAPPTSCFLSRLTPLLPQLRHLDISCPGGLPPDQLLALIHLRNLEEAIVTASLVLFGKVLGEKGRAMEFSLDSSSSSSSSDAVLDPNSLAGPKCQTCLVNHQSRISSLASLGQQDPGRILLQDCFLEFFCFHFAEENLDPTFPHLKSLKVMLHGSRGVSNFDFGRNCLDRIVMRQSWKGIDSEV